MLILAEAAMVALVSLVYGPAVADRWRPPELEVEERAPAAAADELRELALAYLGRPYVMGGVGSPGFDCSGFVCRVYAEAGYAIPRVSRDQAHAGRDVPRARIEAGDLLFFSAEPGGSRIAHVGLYLGNGELVHASTGDGKIVIAELATSWFRDRFVSARRLLPDPGAAGVAGTTSTSTLSIGTSSTSVPRATPAPAIELVEHAGDTMLSPMVRLPPRRAPLSFGPELAGVGPTAIGVRSAMVTERGVLGLVLAPEAALRVDSIALFVAIAVPVRFESDVAPTVGAVGSFGDATRFLRSLSLGLRGADLDLRLTRFGDATLLGGMVVDKLAPGSRVRGVPGLTVERSALSFFGAARVAGVEAEAIVDDVVEPAIAGASVSIPIAGELLRAGGAIATDQAGEYRENTRAITAAEGEVSLAIVAGRSWSVDAAAGAAALEALDRTGAGLRGAASFEHRFGGGARAIGAELHAGWLGARYLGALLGPTYAAERAAALEALGETRSRALLGGGVHLVIGKVAIGGEYEDALGEGRHPFDRSAAVVADIGDLALGGTRVLSFRVAWASRGLFEDRSAHVLHAGACLRLAGWLLGELYAEKGERLEGGAGVTVSFAP